MPGNKEEQNVSPLSDLVTWDSTKPKDSCSIAPSRGHRGSLKITDYWKFPLQPEKWMMFLIMFICLMFISEKAPLTCTKFLLEHKPAFLQYMLNECKNTGLCSNRNLVQVRDMHCPTVQDIWEADPERWRATWCKPSAFSGGDWVAWIPLL